jgi:hypothetical protein
MKYAPYPQTPAPIPPRALNGGLYTGEAFAPGAQYANVPIVPESTTMINEALLGARPPPGANTQYPGGLRPGNNDPGALPGVGRYPGTQANPGPFAMMCVEPAPHTTRAPAAFDSQEKPFEMA